MAALRPKEGSDEEEGAEGVDEAVIQTRLAEVIAFLPDATFVIDTEGKVVLWNRAVEDMTGSRYIIRGSGQLRE